MVSTNNTYIQKVITALNNKFITKSNETGLVKNDGTITPIKTINGTSLLGNENIIIGAESTGTFAELQTLITEANSESTITLNKNYKYDSTTDSSLNTNITIDNNKNLTINGNGHTIDAQENGQIFTVNTGATLILENLKLINAKIEDDDGGAIFNQGTLNVTNCVFDNNQVIATDGSSYGGAINNYGILNVANCTFTNNQATNTETSGNSYGGAINNYQGTSTVTKSTFTNNNAYNAGAIYNEHGTLTVTNSTFNNNQATKTNGNGCGGAIRKSSGNLTIINSTFNSNQATSTSGNGKGGALYDAFGTLNVINCVFNNNQALTNGSSSGGAIYGYDTITVTNCQFLTDSDTLYNVTNIPYENSSNKVTSWSSTVSDTNYPSEKLVKDSLDNKASSDHTHSQYLTSAEIPNSSDIYSQIAEFGNALLTELGTVSNGDDEDY